ncbi:MAG TPA: hypothetical protein VLV15_15950, partial [Dongiaceae bacterium]|nr:hypothetical protein [Dongiaceae bacterium]
IAAVPVLLFAFHPEWTAESTIVEIHGWNLAWLAGTTLVLWRTVLDLPGPDRVVRLERRALAWGILCGVGLAHHTTAVLYVVPETAALLVVLRRTRRASVALAGVALAGAVVPLSSYGYILWRARHPGTAWIWPTLEPTFAGFVAHVTGAIYRGFLGRFAPDPVQAQAITHHILPWLLPALLVSLIGLLTARGFGARAVRAAVLAGSVLQVTFAYHYGVPDPVPYFLPPLALSLVALAEPLGAVAFRFRRPPAAAAVAGVGLALLLGSWILVGTRATIDRRRELERFDSQIRSMWRAVPYDRCILLWPSDMYVKLVLYQRLEHDRPGIEVDSTPMLCQPLPKRRFRERHGFDPLANNGPEHALEPIDPRYFAGRHAAFDPRYLARVNRTIADSAAVPVLLFDGGVMELRKIGNGRGAPVSNTGAPGL